MKNLFVHSVSVPKSYFWYTDTVSVPPKGYTKSGKSDWFSWLKENVKPDAYSILISDKTVVRFKTEYVAKVFAKYVA